MSRAQQVLYDGKGTVEIQLSAGLAIGFDRLDLEVASYQTKLKERRDVSKELSGLVSGLFEHGAIEGCKITIRDKMELMLPERSAKGHWLPSAARLEQFASSFTALTGRTVRVRWFDAATGKTRASDGNAISRFFSSVGDLLTRPASVLDEWW